MPSELVTPPVTKMYLVENNITVVTTGNKITNNIPLILISGYLTVDQLYNGSVLSLNQSDLGMC